MLQTVENRMRTVVMPWVIIKFVISFDFKAIGPTFGIIIMKITTTCLTPINTMQAYCCWCCDNFGGMQEGS